MCNKEHGATFPYGMYTARQISVNARVLSGRHVAEDRDDKEREMIVIKEKFLFVNSV
jgi:hypothetical protein